MDAPDHVRRATVPWRTGDELTECGRPLTDIGSWVERDELQRRLTAWGKRRTSMTVCITCWDTSGRWSTWERDPVEVLARYLRDGAWYAGPTPKGQRIEREVRALAALVAAHQEEFVGYVAALAETGDLAAARTARRRRA